jgi:hypothetical protein
MRAASPPAVVTHRFRRLARGRSSRRRTKMREWRSCRSLRSDRQGGRRVLLPRGSEN